MAIMIILCFLVLFVDLSIESSFTIDYENNRFLRDGQPFQYISAGIHYFRVPHEYWEDRLAKIKAAGLNAIQTYVPWNFHEPQPGKYLWTGDQNLEKFLKIAARYDLVVILRPGPYICAEWENGGFPYWLVSKYPNIKMRSSDTDFLREVDSWWTILFGKLRKHLYSNGGNIIMVQIENEYAYFGCDKKYLGWLRDKAHALLGNSTVLFTVDGSGEDLVKCGSVEGAYPTVDFGVSTYDIVKYNFEVQHKFAPKGPSVNTEFYPGWLDTWGKPWLTVKSSDVVLTMKYMAIFNASWNFYMFHGGTNFGYWAADSITTSYDYDAPLSEAGDPTEKFYAVRQKVFEITGRPLLPVPPASKKVAYGNVDMLNLGPIANLINFIATKQVVSKYPLAQEDLSQPTGFTFYEVQLPKDGRTLNISGIRDRGHVMLDGQLSGIVSVYEKKFLVDINGKKNQEVQILVENMGRSNDGGSHRKGIIENVFLDGEILTNWTISVLDIGQIFKQPLKDFAVRKTRSIKNSNSESFMPSLFYGTFPASEIADTFFLPGSWSKGQFFINGHNIGRYWPAKGPQVTLYVPKFYLKSVNHVLMLELDGPNQCDDEKIHCTVSFVDAPYLNKTV